MPGKNQLNTTQQLSTTILMGRFADRDNDGIDSVAVFGDDTTIELSEDATTQESEKFRDIMENPDTDRQQKNKQLSLMPSVQQGTEVRQKVKVYYEINTIVGFAGSRLVQDHYAEMFKPEDYAELKAKLISGIKDVQDRCIRGEEYFSAELLLVTHNNEDAAHPLEVELLQLSGHARREPEVRGVVENHRITGISDETLDAEMTNFFTPEDGQGRRSYTRDEVATKMQAMIRDISNRQNVEYGKCFTGEFCTGAFINAAGDILAVKNKRDGATSSKGGTSLFKAFKGKATSFLKPGSKK